MFGLGLSRYVPKWLRPAVMALADHVMIRHNRIEARTHRLMLRLSPMLPRDRFVGRVGFPSPCLEVRFTPAVGATPDDQAFVAIIGLFSTPTGLGQGARLMLNDLASRGCKVVAVDVTQFLKLDNCERDTGPLHTDRLDTGTLPISDLAVLPVTDVIIHLNPPQYGRVYLALPRSTTANARVIAYWAWELEKTPPEWKLAAQFCDEIWVPSRFVAQAIGAQEADGHRRPIRIVPHAVEANPLLVTKTAEKCLALRARYGLSGTTFVGGYSFSMRSVFARKIRSA